MMTVIRLSDNTFLALDGLKVTQVDLSRLGIVSDIKFLTGALPSVVAPKIESGLFANVFLKQTEVSICDLEILALLRF